MFPFLQTLIQPPTEATAQQADSIASTSGQEMSLSSAIETIVNTPASELMGSLIDTVINFGLKLIAAFLIYFVGRWVIKKVKQLLKKLFDKRQADAGIASFVTSLASIALTIVLIISIIGTLGIDTTSIAALLTGGGLAIGLALNGTVQNFAGGIMILAFKPFKAGDFIEAQGHSGTVSEINITTTKLTTTDNRVIIIPNGILSNDVINNFSGRQMRRLDITIGVEYGSSSEQTKEILHQLIRMGKCRQRQALEDKTDGIAFLGLANHAESVVNVALTIPGSTQQGCREVEGFQHFAKNRVIFGIIEPRHRIPLLNH